MNEEVPRIVFLKNNAKYRDEPMREAYQFVHEYIEHGIYKAKPEFIMQAEGRISVIGLYYFYIKKEVVNF